MGRFWMLEKQQRAAYLASSYGGCQWRVSAAAIPSGRRARSTGRRFLTRPLTRTTGLGMVSVQVAD